MNDKKYVKGESERLGKIQGYLEWEKKDTKIYILL